MTITAKDLEKKGWKFGTTDKPRHFMIEGGPIGGRWVEVDKHGNPLPEPVWIPVNCDILDF